VDIQKMAGADERSCRRCTALRSSLRASRRTKQRNRRNQSNPFTPRGRTETEAHRKPPGESVFE